MRNFHLVAADVDMGPLHREIVRHPELWNLNTYRTTYENTPHGDADDIWLRYSKEEKTADPKNLSAVQDDHGAVWYLAATTLTEARTLVLDLMRTVNAYQLDRLLISRIKPGGRILPHADDVGDYVHLKDIARYHFVVQGLPGSQFRCGDETIDMRTGEVYWFDAHVEHEVTNNSADDRIHLIADLRIYQ